MMNPAPSCSPAKAGAQEPWAERLWSWAPAFAGELE